MCVCVERARAFKMMTPAATGFVTRFGRLPNSEADSYTRDIMRTNNTAIV